MTPFCAALDFLGEIVKVWHCFLSLRKEHFQCQCQTYLFCRCESGLTIPCLIHEHSAWWMRRVLVNELSISDSWAALRCAIKLKSCYLCSDLSSHVLKTATEGEVYTKIMVIELQNFTHRVWSVDSHIYISATGMSSTV